MRSVSARLSMSVLALGLAAVIGTFVGGLSQLTAVSMADPRPSDSLPFRPSATARPTEPSLTPAPSPTPAPPPTPAQSSNPQVWLYTLQAGDSLSGLALRFGTTTEELLRLNPEYAANQDLVEIGSPVIMPCTAAADAENRC